MAGDAQVTSSDGPGGKASRFLDAVVAFVVALFHPIFRVFTSAEKSPPSHPSSQPSSPHEPPHEDNDDTYRQPGQNNNETARMHPQPQPHSRPAQPTALKAIDANVRPAAAVKVTLPPTGPSNGAIRQENAIAANAAVPVANAHRELTDAKANSVQPRAVGQEQAEENRQEQLTLPPPITTDQAADEQEDPAISAERAIHHGFMNQALDMVS